MSWLANRILCLLVGVKHAQNHLEVISYEFTQLLVK